ncbi:MAG: aspartate-semialdehyde dehydrogenase [Candidatus Cloacimonadales bacterium]|nr:aspartate-semialdehyde dehydrogenase [Candidatus Cloacimonadales bacterium]
MKSYNLAIVGATGVVGQEVLKIMEEREFPIKKLRLLASERSSGQKIYFNNSEIEVQLLDKDSFNDIDFALFSAGSSVSRKFAPIAVQAGAIVIDKSSAFRMDSHVPLVVPEVNPEEVFKHQGIISNPNCSTIQLVVALKPIFDLAGISRLIVSTYQSVSGSGKDAVTELKTQTRQVLQKEKVTRKVYPHQIAFNLLPQIDDFDDNAFTFEEMKLIHETKKILGDEKIKITATAVRVPILIGHSESVYLETKEYISINKLKKIFMETPGIKFVDDITNNKYPMPIMSEVYDEVMIGRLRKDLAERNGINMWIVANNLRKGAALNSVQIVELLIK